MRTEPLQTDEVERHLRLRRECGLTHYSTGATVLIEHDPDNDRAPWRVWCIFDDIPDRPTLARALANGFALSQWPAGDGPMYELSRSFFGMRAAAIRALELIRMLPGVPEDAWVRASIIETSQLDEPRPDPPSPWPPA